MTALLRYLTWLPLVANVLLAGGGPRLARVLPPRVGVRLLPAAMVVVAVGTGTVLTSLGIVALAQVPEIAAAGDWSPVALRASQPGPFPVEVVAGLAVVGLLGSALAHAVRAARALVRVDAACTAPGDVQGLLVVDDEVPEAFALPTLPWRRHGAAPARSGGGVGGVGGRIVVSTGMLRALRADERRVVLAHETAHLAGHHHLYVQLADLAAAANPLLRRSARGVRLAVERAADEAAAAEVGDRRLAARALARAGLARAAAARRNLPPVALAATGRFVADRAAALLAPAPRPRRVLACALVLLAVVTVAGTAAAAQRTDDNLDGAQRAPAATARG